MKEISTSEGNKHSNPFNNLQQAEQNFWWWLDKAKASLHYINAPELQQLHSLRLFLMHQSAEYALKAVISTFSGLVRKTHNPYSLLKLALPLMPAISKVFPNDTTGERVLFQLLISAFLANRFDRSVLPSEEELNQLNERLTLLLQTVETEFLQTIQSLP